MAGGSVSAASVSSTGEAVGQAAFLRGMVLTEDASAGSVEFRDGGASGDVLLTIETEGGSLVESINIPGEGILFGDSIYVTVNNVSNVTLFYRRTARS